MAVTIENLYKPINDFFIEKFSTDATNRISFKFDQFGTKIALEDFAAPKNPEEVFSDFVNRMPQITSDSLNVIFSAKKIDQSYFYELLSPSIPAIPADLSAADTEAITQHVSKLQQKAIADYEMLWQARSGVGDKFWVSYPSPAAWYDIQNKTIWEDYNFKAIDQDKTAASPKGLWKLKLNENQLQQIVPDLTVSRPARLNPKVSRLNKIHSQTSAKPSIQMRFSESYAHLKLMDKVAVLEKIKKHAPSKDVTASQITVRFQYAIIHIRRPWLFDVFLDNGNWRIPGRIAGEVSATGNFRHLPIAFIVVRNLRIVANWSEADKEASKQATNFGPFQLSGQIDESGSLGYDGIQVIGWILQEMFSFPPK